MSLGSLSPKARNLAAMNGLGCDQILRGEDIKRYKTNLESKIKQVASGRFGVTPNYLINEVIQIKIAQGANQVGGQLPGTKLFLHTN